MIKQSEIDTAYLMGRNAAFLKLSEDDRGEKANKRPKPEPKPKPKDDSYSGTKSLQLELDKQKEIARLVGLSADTLLRGQNRGTFAQADNLGATIPYPRAESQFDRLLHHQNAARLAMLGGTLGGTYLGGQGIRSAALSSGGSILGAMAGGNVGRAAAEAANAYIGDRERALADSTKGKLITYGGALGGLGGGLAAGKYLS